MTKSADAFRTISEVADWLEVQTHVLRFWESKFTQVKPIKRAGGRRYYRPADMLLLGGIRKLLHEDGLTIKGVQKILREEGMAYVSDLSQPLDAETTQQLTNDLDAVASYDDIDAQPPEPQDAQPVVTAQDNAGTPASVDDAGDHASVGPGLVPPPMRSTDSKLPDPADMDARPDGAPDLTLDFEAGDALPAQTSSQAEEENAAAPVRVKDDNAPAPVPQNTGSDVSERDLGAAPRVPGEPLFQDFSTTPKETTPIGKEAQSATEASPTAALTPKEPEAPPSGRDSAVEPVPEMPTIEPMPEREDKTGIEGVDEANTLTQPDPQSMSKHEPDVEPEEMAEADMMAEPEAAPTNASTLPGTPVPESEPTVSTESEVASSPAAAPGDRAPGPPTPTPPPLRARVVHAPDDSAEALADIAPSALTRATLIRRLTADQALALRPLVAQLSALRDKMASAHRDPD